MEYIVRKRFKTIAICGEVNIPALSICQQVGGFIYFNGKLLCRSTSENAHQYFSRNDDGCGIRRGELVQSIVDKLQKRDSGYDMRWNLVWNDNVCLKYKRPEHTDIWLWNHEFYEASIKDLEYIESLVTKPI